jgi:hypothetical protein
VSGQDHSSHDEVQMLLPWYATGQLDETDLALVTAHLADCADCRNALVVEQAMERRVAALSFDADLGWADIRRRLAPPAVPSRWRSFGPTVTGRPALIGFAIAAQALLLVTAIVAFAPMQRASTFHVLSATPTPASGNAIMMFRPDAKVDEVMRALDAVDTRIVDGPTSAGAWIVRMPAERRPLLLARLRTQQIVTMAEPTDP